ncbi:hypothetical protein I7I53_07277 [Histoplasma capsulatum var. duboisii H88]|uniref:Uncharacterized protein n=1 Tax=Ajellomyces capsulatus (strain H88) TaxID=544711 RepID=A0A8A1LIN3_AJEC8|nr:hypothetical protein I7I53_07277 [Histoplasma capsulatum var. duboisii H88]
MVERIAQYHYRDHGLFYFIYLFIFYFILFLAGKRVTVNGIIWMRFEKKKKMVRPFSRAWGVNY